MYKIRSCRLYQLDSTLISYPDKTRGFWGIFVDLCDTQQWPHVGLTDSSLALIFVMDWTV